MKPRYIFLLTVILTININSLFAAWMRGARIAEETQQSREREIAGRIDYHIQQAKNLINQISRQIYNRQTGNNIDQILQNSRSHLEEAYRILGLEVPQTMENRSYIQSIQNEIRNTNDTIDMLIRMNDENKARWYNPMSWF